MVKEYKTTAHRAKGKWCHFEKEDFIKHGLLKYYWTPVGKFNPEELKDIIIGVLKKEGFVFFDGYVDYKYETYFGKLKEFAVNYHHII